MIGCIYDDAGLLITFAAPNLLYYKEYGWWSRLIAGHLYEVLVHLTF
jgi:hypothetical protein